MAEQPRRAAHDLVDVDRRALRRPLPREGEEVLHDAPAASDLAVHHLHPGLDLRRALRRNRLPGGERLARPAREDLHAGERVVQFVGHDGRQPPEAGHPLAADHLVLRGGEFARPFVHAVLQRAGPAAQLFVGPLQVAGHRVEGQRDVPQFVVSLERNAGEVVAAAEPRDRAAHRAQAPTEHRAHHDRHHRRGGEVDDDRRAEEPLRPLGVGRVGRGERELGVEHAEDALSRRVVMAGAGARRLAGQRLDHPQHPPADGVAEDPHPLLARQVGLRRTGDVAGTALGGRDVEAPPDLRLVGGEDDVPLLVQQPDPDDVRLAADVVDHLLHVVPAVVEHAGAGGLTDQLGDGGGGGDDLPLEVAAGLRAQREEGDPRPHRADDRRDEGEPEGEGDARAHGRSPPPARVAAILHTAGRRPSQSIGGK